MELAPNLILDLNSLSIVKATGYRYRDHREDVTIYYDLFSDLFAIVSSESNKLLGFSVATELDYADIFRYKSIFQEKTARESASSQLCEIEDLNFFRPTEITCSTKEGPLQRNIPLTGKDKSLNLSNFDKVRNKGLTDNYNLVDGWWLDRQKEIIRSLDPARFGQLSIEFTKSGPKQNVITELEALVVLQAELENLVGGSNRSDMIKIEKERILNFDFKILS